jgi:hypothetical protein
MQMVIIINAVEWIGQTYCPLSNTTLHHYFR